MMMKKTFFKALGLSLCLVAAATAVTACDSSDEVEQIVEGTAENDITSENDNDEIIEDGPYAGMTEEEAQAADDSVYLSLYPQPVLVPPVDDPENDSEF